MKISRRQFIKTLSAAALTAGAGPVFGGCGAKQINARLRLSDEDAVRFRDGLTTESMEIEGIKGWYLRHFAEPGNFYTTGYRKISIDYHAALADQGRAGLLLPATETTCPG